MFLQNENFINTDIKPIPAFTQGRTSPLQGKILPQQLRQKLRIGSPASRSSRKIQFEPGLVLPSQIKTKIRNHASPQPERLGVQTILKYRRKEDYTTIRNRTGEVSPQIRHFEPGPLSLPCPLKKQKANEELWQASSSGNLKKIMTLIEPTDKTQLKAEINSEGPENRTALHWAVYEKQDGAVELLIKYGANLNAQTDRLRTPLHLACILGESKVVQSLLQAGAKVDVQDIDLNTPTHLAVRYNYLPIINQLLNFKPNIAIKNKEGKTAIDLSNSKIIMKMFAKYLSGDLSMTESKTMPSDSNLGVPSIKSISSSASSVGIPKEAPKVGLHSFEFLKLLGKGSFGEVYLAKGKRSGKLYAIKALLKKMIKEQNLRKYAFAEKSILKHLHHPFIVSLHCSFQTEGKLYMVLDYCPGGDLGQALVREKKFDEERARIYTAEILLAIEELHNREIIYRDLKPDNVVLDAEGHALLTDFGLSKEGVKEGDIAQSFCGSVAYLAPEMLHRSGHTKTVDFYLLGVFLYEMLVGSPPQKN